MNIGIVGLGIVGKAIRFGFLSLGHNVRSHDIYLNTRVEDLLESDICYICVPTPSKISGECDISVVESVLTELYQYRFNGIVAIKSTVSPGSTVKLQKKFTGMTICFVPEFLRERCATTDFMENHDICIIGTEDENVFNIIKRSHGKYPKTFSMVKETEAELCKYFNNIYNAMIVVFANSFYEISKEIGCRYDIVKSAMIMRGHIIDAYLDCNDNLRGFGGKCLTKDIKAIHALCEKLNIDVDFFKIILEENSKYKTTVFEGMRNE